MNIFTKKTMKTLSVATTLTASLFATSAHAVNERLCSPGLQGHEIAVKFTKGAFTFAGDGGKFTIELYEDVREGRPSGTYEFTPEEEKKVFTIVSDALEELQVTLKEINRRISDAG